MWRALFMAAGMSLCVLGLETMVVDRVVMSDAILESTPVDDLGWEESPYATDLKERRVFVPPEWAPWGLLSAGAMTVFYASTVRG